MLKFTNTSELSRKIKADLNNRIIPNFLTTVAAAAHIKVKAAIAEKGIKIEDSQPPTLIPDTVTKFPPRAAVTLVAAGTAQQVKAYHEAFKTVYEVNLETKQKFLKMVRGAGVT